MGKQIDWAAQKPFVIAFERTKIALNPRHQRPKMEEEAHTQFLGPSSFIPKR